MSGIGFSEADVLGSVGLDTGSGGWEQSQDRTKGRGWVITSFR